MSSPVGVVSTTIRRSRSVSTRLASARSISAAPAITTSEADNGRSTNLPWVSSSNSRVISSTKPNIAVAPLPDRRERGRRICLDREDRIEAADGKHFPNVGDHAVEGDLALGLRDLLGHDQKHTQAGPANVSAAADTD